MELTETQRKRIKSQIAAVKAEITLEFEDGLSKIEADRKKGLIIGRLLTEETAWKLECSRKFITACKNIYVDVLTADGYSLDINYILRELTQYIESEKSLTVDRLLVYRRQKGYDVDLLDSDVLTKSFDEIKASIKKDLQLAKDYGVIFPQKKGIPQVTLNIKTPSFNFIKNAKLKPILKRDYREIISSRESGCWKAAIILCISTLEGILYDLLMQHKKEAEDKAKQSYTDLINKTTGDIKPIEEWSLSTLINVAYDLKLITKGVKDYSHTSKEFRNLVHPMNEIKGIYSIGEHESNTVFSILKLLISSKE